MISRRIVLKQLAFATAGVALASSFEGCSSPPSSLLKNVTITQDQEALLRLITETIIPKTSTPGAAETKVMDYSVKMIDDCMSKADQAKWLSGLNQFSALADKDGFMKNELASQVKFLSAFDESKEENDVNFFFKTMKRLTVRGYTSSEYFMTNVQHYQMIPGKFKGCVPVATA